MKPKRAESERTDAELLQMVKAERSRSLGFDLDPELTDQREKALNYAKGVMNDVPALPNRSKAVSTDIADAIETVLPDLIEIFTGGDDVVAFQPTSQADEAQAEQETDYLHYVVFDQNAGFINCYSFFKDALLTKTGIMKWWWENAPQADPETFEGKTIVEVLMASKDGEISNVRPCEEQPEGVDPANPGDPNRLYDFEILKEGPDGKICCQTWAPEDFTVARDTVALAETTYCATRSRVRAQDLKADGCDADIIDTLPPYGLARDEQVPLARDRAGEHQFPVGNDGPDRDMRVVEVVDHYIRVLEGNEKVLYRIFTGGNESILIEKERLDGIPLAAITPFLVTHRFYGESIADKLLEIQRIKTALTRASLDSIYFALNQRPYVDITQLGDHTISDLLTNEPGRPIRGNGPNAVTMMTPAPSGVDYFAALEYVSTAAEQRTGIVRNAQGLNPDTLHDTMGGQMALMGEAQKRVRLIARIFAETGLKDMFLGVHALIRKHASKKQIVKLRGSWVPVDPTQWTERTSMTVEVGVGAGGKDQKRAALTQVLGLQGQIAKDPDAKPLVTLQNAYNAASDAMKAAGLKQPDLYITDPSTAAPPPAAGPNPEALKVQAQQQNDQAKNQIDQGKLALEQQKLELEQGKMKLEVDNSEAARQQELTLAGMKDQREQQSIQAEHDREMARLQLEAEIKQAELALKAQELAAKTDYERLKLQTETQVKLAEIQSKSNTAIEVADITAGVNREQIVADLLIQRSESDDAQLAAHHSREHEVGMAVVDHELGERAAEAAAERQPEPEPKGEGGAE